MIRIGTRGSELAFAQAREVADLLGCEKCKIVKIKTKGDKIQNLSFDKIEGKGFFTREIEEALLTGKVDIAIHSLKDLPVENVPGLKIGAVLPREDPADLLIIRKDAFNSESEFKLVKGARVGTSALRRSAQLKYLVKDCQVIPLRGNVTTRINKLRNKDYDAIILAAAGINRLDFDLSDLIVERLPLNTFLPAPAQGAIAVQLADNKDNLFPIINELNDFDAMRAVNAERKLLSCFGGGCSLPLGAFAFIYKGQVEFNASFTASDGSVSFKYTGTGTDEELLVQAAAHSLREQGVGELLEDLY